jgi:hypothetical protein
MSNKFYVTKKQVEAYITNKLDLFENVDTFKQEVDKTLADFSEDDKAQIKFFSRVSTALEKFIV